jgi:hypothetical protein
MADHGMTGIGTLTVNDVVPDGGENRLVHSHGHLANINGKH